MSGLFRAMFSEAQIRLRLTWAPHPMRSGIGRPYIPLAQSRFVLTLYKHPPLCCGSSVWRANRLPHRSPGYCILLAAQVTLLPDLLFVQWDGTLPALLCLLRGIMLCPPLFSWPVQRSSDICPFFFLLLSLYLSRVLALPASLHSLRPSIALLVKQSTGVLCL